MRRALLGSVLLVGVAFAFPYTAAPRADSFTVEAWVRLDSLGLCPIFYRSDRVTLGLDCSPYGPPHQRTRPLLFVGNAAWSVDGLVQGARTPPAAQVPLGRWVHVAATFNGPDSAYFLLDGEPLTGESAGGPPYWTLDPALAALAVCPGPGASGAPVPHCGRLYELPGEVGDARVTWWPRTAEDVAARMGSRGRLGFVLPLGRVDGA